MDIRTRTAIPITVLVVYMNEIRIDVCKPSQLLRPWGIARTNGNGVLIFYSLPLHLSHIKKHIGVKTGLYKSFTSEHHPWF